MTIYDIKRLTNQTSPYFFSRNTLKFFKQTLKDFRVYKQKDGKYLITAPMYRTNDNGKLVYVSDTKRLFNPITNELELIKKV